MLQNNPHFAVLKQLTWLHAGRKLMQVLPMLGDCPLPILHSTVTAYIFRETNCIGLVRNSIY